MEGRDGRKDVDIVLLQLGNGTVDRQPRETRSNRHRPVFRNALVDGNGCSFWEGVDFDPARDDIKALNFGNSLANAVVNSDRAVSSVIALRARERSESRKSGEYFA